jgi:hypothetical protein
MMSQVYTATPADVKDAAHTIVRAFIRDPFNVYFYNLMPDQSNPPCGTEEMMAIHIYNKILTDLVLVVDDEDRKCAGVALWMPPRFEPLGWFEWGAKWIHSVYGGIMGHFYYRDRGINRQVVLLQMKANSRDWESFVRFRPNLWKEFSEKGLRRIRIICIS